MSLFVGRYDLRCPDFAGWNRTDLYRVALEQIEWMDGHGFNSVVLSEHHGVEDGYLSSPMTMAGAVGARTNQVAITIAALLTPLYDPVRLAEDIAVVQSISAGRLTIVMGLGYRQSEYDMLDVDWKARGAVMEESLTIVKAALAGETVDHRGAQFRVTPVPDQPPLLLYGGGSAVAAKRAARLDMPLMPQHTGPEVAEIYQAERERLGLGPGMVLQPSTGPGTIYCAEDPEKFWAEAGEHLLYEATQYSSWQDGVTSAVHDRSQTVEEMKQAGVYAVMTPDEMIEYAIGRQPLDGITTHPLCGGMPEDLSWSSLDLIGNTVIPAVREAAS